MTPAIRTATPDDDTVVVTTVVPAPVERVFRAFTDAADLARWWWPERFATAYEIDARAGGTFRMATTALPDDQRMAVRGTYLGVTPTRLDLTWQWDGESEVSRVAIELRALDSGRTEVIVTHSANRSADARDAHGQGWRDCLARLVEYL